MTKELVIAPPAASISDAPCGSNARPAAGRGAALWLAALCLLAAAPGCARHHYYYAQTLPYELQAKPVENAQTIDLSRLAVAGNSTEAIDSEDVLEVSIVAGLGTNDTLTVPVRILENGSGHIPGVGLIPLAGLDLQSAEAVIAAAVVQNGLYRSPHVTVTMKKQRMCRVTVLGGVRQQGIIELPKNDCNLLAAITKAGGLADNAGTYVEIRQPATPTRSPRPAPIATGQDGTRATGYSPPSLGATAGTSATAGGFKSVRINLVTAAREGRGGQVLEDGSVVNVEKRDPTPIQVIGLVRDPGRYEFPVGQDLRLLDAIALAKGVSSKMANSILVTRPQPDGAEPLAIKVKISDAKRYAMSNMLLQPGDVVSVEQTAGTVFLDMMQIIRFGFTSSLSPLLF